MIITDEIMERLLAIEIANLETRLTPYAQREGNPSGIYMKKFARGTAFIAEKIGVRFFNSLIGFGPDTMEHLDAIRAFYREHGVKGAFEIVPSRFTEAIGLELVAKGYAMVEFHVALARALGEGDRSFAMPDGVSIEEVDRGDARGFDRFLDTYLEGWATDPMNAEDAKENMRGWRSIAPEVWRFYLARCDGAPAGAAILDLRGKTAMLGSASTKKALRGRGVQGALIDQRIADAAKHGCDLMISGAYFGTPSMRNQQRKGFVTACTKGIWIDQR